MNTKISFSAALTVLLTITVALRAFGLSDARLIDLDEYRAVQFEIDHTALFRSLYSVWGAQFGQLQAGYLALSVILSGVSLIFVYALGKGVGRCHAAGLLMATFLGLSSITSWYARSAYPVTLAGLLLCAAVLCWHRSIASEKHRNLWLGAVGASCALLCLSYFAWYPTVLALLLSAVALPRVPGKPPLRILFVRAAVLAAAFTATYISGAWLLTSIAGLPASAWITRLIEIQQWGATFVPRNPLQIVGSELGKIFRKEFIPLLGGLLLVFLFKPRISPFANSLLVTSAVALAIAVLPAMLGINTLYERNLVGQLILLQLGLGMVLVTSYVEVDATGRRGFERSLTLLLCAALPAVYIQRREMFSVTPINAWLAANNAQPANVLTLVDIAEPGARGPVTLPHLQAQTPARPRAIDWNTVAKIARERPELRYLLLTDFYQLRVSGPRDRQLWRSDLALATFPHPVAGEGGIRIYDLQSALKFEP